MAWCTYQVYATNLEHKLIGMKIFHSKNHVVIDFFENFIMIGVQCTYQPYASYKSFGMKLFHSKNHVRKL